jgi:hypothetical protein
MGNVDASARHRRLITFSVLGVIILGLCACNKLLPGNLLADRLDPPKVPKYKTYELDDRSCHAFADPQPNKRHNCYVVTMEKTTDMQLLVLVVKDLLHNQRITDTDDWADAVWVQFSEPNSHYNFETFATGFYLKDKDDPDWVLSDEEERRATVVDNVYVLEGTVYVN